MRIRELIYQTTLYKKRIRIVGNRCDDILGVEIDFHTAWSLVDAGLLNGRCYVQPALPYGLVYHNDALDTRSHWAERQVAKLIGAELAPPRTPGYDAVLSDGRRVQVKCASWYVDRTRRRANLKINKRIDYDILVVALTNPERPNDPTAFDFFVLEPEIVRELAKNVTTHVCISENSPQYKLMQKYRYDVHGLRRAFSLPVEENANDSPQVIIDLYIKQPLDLMPYDSRYEADDFYAELIVAHLTGGTITEQKCPGHDVVMRDDTRISVKFSNRQKNGAGLDQIKIGRLRDDYDVIVALFWEDERLRGDMDLSACRALILPREFADAVKEPNNMIRFAAKRGTKSRDKFTPFFFTLSHLAELREIGYAKFHEKYLREPTEAALRRLAS